MKIKFPFFAHLYRLVRNVVLLLIVVFLVQYIIAGSSLKVSVRYQDIPLHKYRQQSVCYDWKQGIIKGAVKVFKVAKEVKDAVL